MSRVFPCPRCGGQILVPAAATLVERRRCPLCGEEFALEQVAATMQAGPPLAPIVDLEQRTSHPAFVGPLVTPSEGPSGATNIANGRRDRAQKSGAAGLFGNLLGIVGGGLGGLVIGYVLLVRLGGPHYDFLELEGRVPDWLVPTANSQVELPELRSTRAAGEDGTAIERPKSPHREVPLAVPALAGDTAESSLWDPLESTCRHASLSIL